MQKINHRCVVCGEGYHACDTCLEEKTFKPWRTLTDSIDHYKIFMILRNYNNKALSKAEARKMLENVNIDGWQNFRDNCKNVMLEIMEDENTLHTKKVKTSTIRKTPVKQKKKDD